MNLDEKFQKLKKPDFVVGVDTGSTYQTHPLIDLAGPTKKPVTTKPSITTTEAATTTTVESSTSGMFRFSTLIFNFKPEFDDNYT